MTRVPSPNYDKVFEPCAAMAGSSCGRGGSHVRLQKHAPSETLEITVPAHEPIKRSTLSHIVEQARLELVAFLCLL